MKTLNQLGVSPAPWKVNDRELDCDNEISCEYISDIIVKGKKRTKIVARCNAYFDTYKPDALLIAAAPELYEALRMYQEAFAEIRKSAWFIDANFYEIMNLNKVMTAADAALAKAAGESEVEK